MPRKNQQNYAGEVEELCDDVFFVAASPGHLEFARRLRWSPTWTFRFSCSVKAAPAKKCLRTWYTNCPHALIACSSRSIAPTVRLLESELFGYEAGASTGATHPNPRVRVRELCNKGTILLDEIGEMPPSLQAKLLHVLQDQQFSRLGSRTVIKVDVRILAATNINIPEALANKRLRRSTIV